MGVRRKICPYKGLEYFDFNPTKPEEAEDHRYLYGRTQLTNQLFHKVRSGNFLAWWVHLEVVNLRLLGMGYCIRSIWVRRYMEAIDGQFISHLPLVSIRLKV